MKPESKLKMLQNELAEIENKHANSNKSSTGIDTGTSKQAAKGGNAWLENSPVCTKIIDADFNLQYMSKAGVQALKIKNIEEYYNKPYPGIFPERCKRGNHKPSI